MSAPDPFATPATDAAVDDAESVWGLRLRSAVSPRLAGWAALRFPLFRPVGLYFAGTLGLSLLTAGGAGSGDPTSLRTVFGWFWGSTCLLLGFFLVMRHVHRHPPVAELTLLRTGLQVRREDDPTDGLTFPWASLSHWYASGQMFGFLVKGEGLYVLPKRDLTPGQEEAVVRALRAAKVKRSRPYLSNGLFLLAMFAILIGYDLYRELGGASGS